MEMKELPKPKRCGKVVSEPGRELTGNYVMDIKELCKPKRYGKGSETRRKLVGNY